MLSFGAVRSERAWPAELVERLGRVVEARTLTLGDEGRIVYLQLSDLLAGSVDVPRAGDAPVLFETQGVAIQDVAVAALAYERYRAGTPTPSH